MDVHGTIGSTGEDYCVSNERLYKGNVVCHLMKIIAKTQLNSKPRTCYAIHRHKNIVIQEGMCRVKALTQILAVYQSLTKVG